MTNETETRIPLADLLVFHQLTRSLTSSFDLDTILRTILEHMEHTIEAELWTLLMLDEDSDELYYAIAAGGEQHALRGLRVKVGEGVAGWVAAHGETLIVPESSHDPRLTSEQAGNPKNVRSVIAMPLRGRKGTHGVIEIFNPRVAISSFNEEAARFAAKYRLTAAAGSDAHVAAGLGSVRVRMRDFDGPTEFKQSLRDAQILTRPSSLLYVQALKFLQTRATPAAARRASKARRLRRLGRTHGSGGRR